MRAELCGFLWGAEMVCILNVDAEQHLRARNVRELSTNTRLLEQVHDLR